MNQSNYIIKRSIGYSAQIGNFVSLFKASKSEILKSISSLSIEQLDFFASKKSNSIGTLLKHMIALEHYCQIKTFYKREFTKDEEDYWHGALPGELILRKIKGNPIEYYIHLWDNIRKKTYEGFKMYQDNWFYEHLDSNFPENGNNLWLWFHVMEDQICHHGQIKLILNELKRLNIYLL